MISQQQDSDILDPSSPPVVPVVIKIEAKKLETRYYIWIYVATIFKFTKFTILQNKFTVGSVDQHDS